MPDGAKLATAYYELIPSMRGSERQISSQLVPAAGRAGGLAGEGLRKGMIGKLAGIGGAIGAALAAGAGIKEFFQTGFEEASDASAGTAQLAAGIKSTGNVAKVSTTGLNNLAAAIQGYSGQTDDSIVASEKLLLTFTNIRNVGPDKIFDQATKATADMAARMGGDASSKAVLLGKALNDPVKGITALTRVGVAFTAGQKNQISALVKTGDTLGAQKIILAELNKEFGGSAKAAGESFPGVLARLRRSFEDFSQGAFQALVPVLIPAFKLLIDGLQRLTPAITSFSETATASLGKIDFGGIVAKVKGVLAPFTSAFAAFIPPILSGLAPLVPAFLQLATTISPLQLVLKGLAPLLPALGLAFGQIAATVAGSLASAVTQLTPFATQLADKFVQFVPVLGEVALAILPLVSSLLDLALPLLTSKTAIYALVAGLVVWKATTVGISLAALISGLVASTTTLFTNTAAWVTNTAAMLASKVETLAIVGLYAGGFVASIASTTAALVAQAATWISTTAAMVGSRIALVAGSVATGAATAAQWLFNAALTANPIGIVVVAIAALVAGLIYFFTQTKTGQRIWSGFTAALVVAFNAAKAGVSAAVRFLGSIISAQIAGARVVILALVAAARAMAAGVGAAVNTVGGFFTGLKARIVGAIGNASSFLLDVGRNIVDGLAQGIRNAWGNVTSIVSGLTNSLPAIVKKALGIHSPSRVFAQLGQYISQGLAKGIKSGSDGVASAMRSMTNTVLSAFDSKKITKTQQATLLAVISSGNTGLTRLADRRKAISHRLTAANKALVAAVKVKTDYKASVLSGLTTFDTTAFSSPASLISSLTQRVAQTKTFTAVMSKLRKQGLDSATYKQFIAAGVDALPQAQSLLSGGQASVKKIASLQGQLRSASSTFASSAASDLYGAGVNAARGLVNGLKSQQAAITKQMQNIASRMVATIRKALGIHSPSRVMASLGQHVPTGFAAGIEAKTKVVDRAMGNLTRLPTLASASSTALGSSGYRDNRPVNVNISTPDPEAAGMAAVRRIYSRRA